MSDGGAKFLKDRFNLHATPEVDAAARGTHDELRRDRDAADTPEERAKLAAQSEQLGRSAEAKIENYLDRLLKITEYGTNADPDHGRRQLKRLLHNNYVIKEQEIPQAYFDLQGQIIENRGQREELRQTGVEIK